MSLEMDRDPGALALAFWNIMTWQAVPAPNFDKLYFWVSVCHCVRTKVRVGLPPARQPRQGRRFVAASMVSSTWPFAATSQPRLLEDGVHFGEYAGSRVAVVPWPAACLPCAGMLAALRKSQATRSCHSLQMPARDLCFTLCLDTWRVAVRAAHGSAICACSSRMQRGSAGPRRVVLPRELVPAWG